VVVHSTLTNSVTRAWLEKVRRGEVNFDDFGGSERGGSGGGGGGKRRKNDVTGGSGGGGGGGGGSGGSGGGGSSVHHISLLEPHKRYQNSFTILQKRPEGWEEPVYTKEA
jgi:hypothetical protein